MRRSVRTFEDYYIWHGFWKADRREVLRAMRSVIRWRPTKNCCVGQ